MLQIAHRIVNDLEKAHLLAKVRRIILFGSRARGDADVRSDIDLAFDCPAITQADWLAIVDTLEECATLLKIDAVNYNEASEDLRHNINIEGVVIYEHDKNSTKSD